MGSQKTPFTSGKNYNKNLMSLSNSIDQISSQHKENVAVLFDEWEKVKADLKKDGKVTVVDKGSTLEYRNLEKDGDLKLKDFKPFDLEQLKERRPRDSSS